MQCREGTANTTTYHHVITRCVCPVSRRVCGLDMGYAHHTMHYYANTHCVCLCCAVRSAEVPTVCPYGPMRHVVRRALRGGSAGPYA